MKRAAPSDGGAPPAKRVTKAQALLDEKVAEAVEKAKAEALLALDASKKALEDTLQCGVCLSLVFEPVTPACGHNTCFECICGVLAASPANPLCPTCRKPVEKDRTKLSINAGLVNALEVNNGPGYRGQVKTMKFHALIREDKPALALECLKDGGVDFSKVLRLPAGASKPALYHALEKDTKEWEKLATALIEAGVDLNTGVGALDSSRSAYLTKLLLNKGATKCTPVAFCITARWTYTHYAPHRINVFDQALVTILKLLPKPLSKVDTNLQNGLFYCLTYGHGLAALALLEAGIPLNLDCFEGTPPIHLATSRGLLDVVKAIVARDPLSLSIISPGGYTPLHVACLHGHADVARFLIEKGCGVNQEMDNYGNNPGFYADRWVAKGNKDMVGIWDLLNEDE